MSWEDTTPEEMRLDCLRLAQEMEEQQAEGKWRQPTAAKVIARAKAYYDFVTGKGVEKATQLEVVESEPAIIFTLEDRE